MIPQEKDLEKGSLDPKTLDDTKGQDKSLPTQTRRIFIKAA